MNYLISVFTVFAYLMSVIAPLVLMYFFYRLGKNTGYVDAYGDLMKATGLPRLVPPNVLALKEKEHEAFVPFKDPTIRLKGKADIF
jgi:hypothetical protein